jgi:phage-related protein
MDGSLIGALRVTLGIDTAVFEEGLGIAQKRLNAAGKRFQQVGQQMSDIGKTLSVAVTAPILAAGAAAIQGAQQQAQAMAQVNAALASMGDGVGRTADQLLKASDAMELNSLFEGDEILSKVTANLLTFGNVAGEQFDRAQQAAVDLATRMGTDLQSATVMIGKALNDPIQGISALRRVGVQLTDSQEQLIRSMVATGDTAGAQGVILAELERQFGGAAKAAADTSPWRRAQVAIAQAGDAIGAILIPVVEKIAGFVEGVALSFNGLSPGMQNFIVIAGGVAAAVGPLLIIAGSLVSAWGAIVPMFAGLATILGTAGFTATLGALAAAAAPFIAAGVALAAAWALFGDKIGPVLSSLGAKFSEVLGPKLISLFNTVKAALTQLWNGPFGEAVRVVIDVLGDFGAAYASVLGEALVRVLSAAVSLVEGAFKQIVGAVTLVVQLLSGDFAGAWETAKGMVKNAVDTFINLLNSLVPGAGTALRNMATGIYTRLSEIASSMLQMGRDIIAGLVRGIMAAPEAVWNALKSVVLRGVQNIREFLGIASPSRLFMEMGGFITDGLAIGIQNGSPTVEAAMGSLSDVVATGLQDITGSADVTVGTDTEGDGDTDEGPVPVAESAGSDLRENFKRTFTEGVKAALKGDLKGFFQKWFEDAGNRALDSILNQFADGLLQALGSVLGGSAGGAGGTGGGLGGILTTVFSSLFGGGGGGFAGFAHGGAVHANVPIIVGENRPEMFVPSTAGRIIPNLNELRAGQGSRSNSGDVYMNFNGPVSNQQEVRRSAAQAGRELLRLNQMGQRGA